MGITARNGSVLQIAVNETTLVPYVVNTLRDTSLAIQLAARLNLPGADDLYATEFQRLLASNDVSGAARLAGESPNGESGICFTPVGIVRAVSVLRIFEGVSGTYDLRPSLGSFIGHRVARGKSS